MVRCAAMSPATAVVARTVGLLTISNCFMLCAWYLHLRWLDNRAWYVAAAASWGIAFFEYTVHIPANRIGATELSLSQLQILQIGMSLLIFMPFSVLIMKAPIKLDYIWASILLMGAAYFVFRN